MFCWLPKLIRNLLKNSNYCRVTERVLPTCKIIHSSLAGDLSVDCQIGVTLGKVYCGVVGSVKRHEYAVLGPSVNLAARLMSQKNHPGVLVDDTVRVKAKKFNFVAFPPVKAKGYSDLVPVFKPLTAKEARWGRVNPDFVGREEEMRQVSATMVDMVEGDGASRIFLFGANPVQVRVRLLCEQLPTFERC